MYLRNLYKGSLFTIKTKTMRSKHDFDEQYKRWKRFVHAEKLLAENCKWKLSTIDFFAVASIIKQVKLNCELKWSQYHYKYTLYIEYLINREAFYHFQIVFFIVIILFIVYNLFSHSIFELSQRKCHFIKFVKMKIIPLFYSNSLLSYLTPQSF